MSLILVTKGMNTDNWVRELRAHNNDQSVKIWPKDASDVADVKYALAWLPPHGALAKLPNLEVIFSLGAGVDHLVNDPQLPKLPIVRIVDPNLTMRMTEYVMFHVLLHHRRFHAYDQQQKNKQWEVLDQPAACDVRVGVMGMGVLGSDAALKLQAMGFQVAGWSGSRKNFDGIESFAGQDELKAFLNRTDILVSLLPHTPDTHGILNAELFGELARDGALPGPILINAGRGKLQVEADILSALESGTLHAASLDVFEAEPLATTSALWSHERVTITPHNASESNDKALSKYILDQIARYEAGEALENVIDNTKGY